MARLASFAIFAAFWLIVGNIDQTTVIYIDEATEHLFNIIHVIRNTLYHDAINQRLSYINVITLKY